MEGSLSQTVLAALNRFRSTPIGKRGPSRCQAVTIRSTLLPEWYKKDQLQFKINMDKVKVLMNGEGNK